jgi:hypothetical protein
MVLYGALSISKTSFVRLRILRQHEMALLDVADDVRRGALTDGWQPLILLKFLVVLRQCPYFCAQPQVDNLVAAGL